MTEVVLRQSMRSGALWGLVFAFYIAVQTLAYTSAYPTRESRNALLAAYGNNLGLNALIGPAREINTVDGYAAWRLLGVLSILGAVWGLLTATRLVRGEEDSGRTELLLAGQATRRGGTLQTMFGLAGGLVVLFGLTLAGTMLAGWAPSVGFSVGQSLFFALTLIAGAATFLAVGVFTSELAATRRRAAAYAAGAFGIAYALRMIADSQTELHWLVWLTPLGWIEESRPLTDPNPAALFAVLAFVAVLAVMAVWLSDRRDLGTAILPERNDARARLMLLQGPVGLAIRQTRPAAIGWLLAVVGYALLIGSVARGSAHDTAGSASIEQAIARLGGHGSLVRLYLGLTFLVVALLIALIACTQLGAIRSEETGGRLTHLLVRPVGRRAWFAGRLLLTGVLMVVAAMIAGVATWVGAASGHSSVGLGALVAAGLNTVPPALLLLGFGALAYAVRPAMTLTVAYGYLAWSFLIEFLGAVVHANHWLMDTSMFFHLAPAPATAPNWAEGAIMVGVALLLASAAVLLFAHRDVGGE